MNNYLQLADTLSGKEGSCFLTENGKNRELFEIISIKAEINYKKTAKQTLGNRQVQHKVVGMEGTGSLKGYFISSAHGQSAYEYLSNNKIATTSIMIKNEDSQSSIGSQTVVLHNVLFDAITLASLDVESEDPIQFEANFTFDNFEVLEAFVTPVNYR